MNRSQQGCKILLKIKFLMDVEKIFFVFNFNGTKWKVKHFNGTKWKVKRLNFFSVKNFPLNFEVISAINLAIVTPSQLSTDIISE